MCCLPTNQIPETGKLVGIFDGTIDSFFKIEFGRNVIEVKSGLNPIDTWSTYLTYQKNSIVYKKKCKLCQGEYFVFEKNDTTKKIFVCSHECKSLQNETVAPDDASHEVSRSFRPQIDTTTTAEDYRGSNVNSAKYYRGKF